MSPRFIVGALAVDFGAEHGQDRAKVLAELLGRFEDGDPDVKRPADEEDNFGPEAQKPVSMGEDDLAHLPLRESWHGRRVGRNLRL